MRGEQAGSVVLIFGQRVFDNYGKIGMSEFGGMFDVPEEGVVGIGTLGCGEAWSRDVGESEVTGILLNGSNEAEHVETMDVDAFIAVFKPQEDVEPLIGGQARGGGELNVTGGSRESADVEQVGDEEMTGSRVAQDALTVGDGCSNLEAEIVGAAGGGAEDVVAAAFQDVKCMRIGLTAVRFKIESYLLRHAGNGA